MYTMKLVVLISIIGLLVNNCMCWRMGSNKYWLPNLEWLTSDNWINHTIPRSKDRILFPLDMYHSVGVDNDNLELSGIELSYDGSLVLARNGILRMNNVKREQNNIIKWKLKGPLFWMDPQNWNVSNEAIPHIERIPCATDIVILPDKNRTLSIRLPNSDVEVMEIKRGNQEILDEWSWQALIKGREFRNSRTSVKYSGLQYCGADCLCKPNNIEELVEEICYIQNTRCKHSNCEYPLKVEGHCCDYCGGRISVTPESASISMLTQLSNEALENYRGGVSWHVRASWNGRGNQVLFAENGIYSGIKSQEAMDKLAEILIAKGITIIDFENTGAPLTGSTIANILGPMLGIPLIIFILIIVSFPYFGYSYSHIVFIWREAYGTVYDGVSPNNTLQSNESFSFARFENVIESDVQFGRVLINENEIDYQHNANSNDSEDKNDDDNTSDSSKQFANPLYKSRSKIPSVQTINEEKIIDINATISLSELEKSSVYASDNTNIDDD